MHKVIFVLLLVWGIGVDQAIAKDNFGFGEITDRSPVPLENHVFYSRADLVLFCVDHDLTFDSDKDACARPFSYVCKTAVPYNWKFDRREMYAICNGWHPHFKDLFR